MSHETTDPLNWGASLPLPLPLSLALRTHLLPLRPLRVSPRGTVAHILGQLDRGRLQEATANHGWHVSQQVVRVKEGPYGRDDEVSM